MSSQRAPEAVIKCSGGWKTDYIMKQVYTHAMRKDVKEKAEKSSAEPGAILGQNDFPNRNKNVSSTGDDVPYMRPQSFINTTKKSNGLKTVTLSLER